MRHYKILFFILSHHHQNRLRRCVKLSVSFHYLSDSELYEDFRNIQSLLK